MWNTKEEDHKVIASPKNPKYLWCHVVLYISLVNKSLQFNLYMICKIPVVHPVLKKLFEYSIQEEYLAIRSDSWYISFPISADIMACQVLNGQFCHINFPLYAADISKSCSYTLFLNEKVRINSDCILSVINQTQDEAISIYFNFLEISTLQDEKNYTWPVNNSAIPSSSIMHMT